MKIRAATDRDRTAWDAYVLRHVNGLAYHRYAWKEAVEQAYGFAGRYLMAETDGRLRGVLPLIHFRGPLWPGKLVSLPYCDVGGPLADDAATERSLVASAQTLLRQSRTKGLDLRVSGAQGRDGLKDEVRKVRQVLDLPENSEALLAGFKAKLRSQVLKPGRDGLTFRFGDVDLMTDFYAVFTENMRDLGSPVHSREWFVAILRHFGQDARVGVVYAASGEPAAGALVLSHGTTLTVPWASSLRRFNRQNPNMLLYWRLLSFAADGGYRLFDFGRSTPGEGTYRFKKQWGARDIPLVWREFSPQGRERRSDGSRTPGRERLEALWTRMPLVLCNFLGPRIRRYVSL
jgi:FemAB-related protein (PEP-CTERM system-associated)